MKIKLCCISNHWYIYLNSDGEGIKWIVTPMSLETRDDIDGQYRLRKHRHPEIPVHSFGYYFNDPEGKHKRRTRNITSVTVNGLFGTELIGVFVDGLSVAVPISWLKKTLSDKVLWKKDKWYGEKIAEVVGEENVSGKWVSI